MNYAFIYLADIHYRKDAPEGASSIMRAFLEDLCKQTKALPNHQFYIAFAGDIEGPYSGTDCRRGANKRLQHNDA